MPNKLTAWEEIKNHRGTPLLLLAGPGTGKTKMIGERIRDLIRVDHVDSSKITGVTFTNLAAQEMGVKLLKLGLPCERHPRLATLHYIAKGILHNEAGKVGLDRNFLIADKIESDILAKDAVSHLRQRGVRVAAGDLKRWKQAVKEMKTRALKEKGAFSNGIEPRNPQWKAYCRIYDSLLRGHNSVDWWDVIYLVIRILTSGKASKDYAIQNQHLLVDEYQDLNGADRELINLLCGSRAGLFAVGDDDQCIYETSRCATPEGIIKFVNSYPDYQPAELMTCYRCPNEILGAAQALISNNKIRALKEFGPYESGGSVLKLSCKSAMQEKKMLVRKIARWFKGNDCPLRILVLLPSRGLAREYGKYLEEAGLPVKIYSQDLPDGSIRRLQIMLRLVTNIADGLAVRQALDYLEGVGATIIGRIQHQAMKKKISMWEAIQLAIEHPRQVQIQANACNSLSKLVALVEELQGLQEKPLAILQELIRFLRCEGDEVDQLVDWAEEQENLNLTELLRRIGVHKEAAEESAASVVKPTTQIEVMTMHRAKGINRDLVFLPALEDEFLPGKSSNIEEQRRLLYVSMTRARQQLTLSCTWQRTGRATRRFGSKSFIKRQPSRFLYEIPGPISIYSE